jgi:hypothetical protein
VDLTTSLTALGGKSYGSTWRKRALPESSDFGSFLSSPSVTQYTLMQNLIDETKDALLQKALIAKKTMA